MKLFLFGLLSYFVADIYASKAPKVIREFNEDDFIANFHSAQEVNQYLEYLHKKFPERTKLSVIGKTYEKRPIQAFSVIPPNAVESPEELIFMGTLHGREWSAVTSLVYSLTKALNETSEFIQTYIPLVNPDGYEFTYLSKSMEVTNSSTRRRLWRKNRRNLCSRENKKSAKCAHGVDLNRNFGVSKVSWGFGSPKATSEVFQGKRPMSEAENKAIAAYIKKQNSVKGLIDVHCCSAAVLTPFYYKGDPQTKKDADKQMCQALASSASESAYSCRDRETSFSESNSGVAVDYVYNELGVENVILLETRGKKGSHRIEDIFLVDESGIVGIGSDVHNMIRKFSIILSEKEMDGIEVGLSEETGAGKTSLEVPVAGGIAYETTESESVNSVKNIMVDQASYIIEVEPLSEEEEEDDGGVEDDLFELLLSQEKDAATSLENSLSSPVHNNRNAETSDTSTSSSLGDEDLDTLSDNDGDDGNSAQDFEVSEDSNEISNEYEKRFRQEVDNSNDDERNFPELNSAEDLEKFFLGNQQSEGESFEDESVFHEAEKLLGKEPNYETKKSPIGTISLIACIVAGVSTLSGGVILIRKKLKVKKDN